MKRYILFFVLFFAFTVKAQTGINTEVVSQHAALQVVAPNYDKGVLIPRLTTVERDAITPQATENGLLIYNLDQQCLNYWSKQESEWKSLCGKLGKAELKVSDCSAIKVYGTYKDGQAMEDTNFITLEVEVTKVGSYAILVNSSPHNGYYYATSGEFLSTGTYELTLPAGGQPVSHGVDTFTVAIDGQVTETPCQFDVRVEDASIAPNYRMDCNGVTVHGVYKQDQPLNSTHYIEVVLQVDPSAFPNVGAGQIAYYTLETNEVDGIKFKGQGQLNSSTIRARLYGEGVPISTENKRFVIKSNSALTSGICYANVRVVIPKKRILTIGYKDVAGINLSFASSMSHKLLISSKNYGELPESNVAYEGFDSTVIIDGTNVPTLAKLRSWMIETNPVDIVVVGWSWTMSSDAALIFLEYLQKGGVVLSYNESLLGVKTMMTNLLGDNSLSTTNIHGGGAVYKFSNIDDPILNGPFGDIRGKYWGEDRTSTVAVSNIDTSNLIVYSDGFNWSASFAMKGFTAFRHRDYHLVWVGDGGFNASLDDSSIGFPFKIDNQSYPIERKDFGVSKKYPVQNAIFTANAIAWAIQMAEESGINSDKGGK